MERPENGDVGICGVQLVDEENQVSRTCARFPTLGRVMAGALGLDRSARRGDTHSEPESR